jgi:hypothetical protein
MHWGILTLYHGVTEMSDYLGTATYSPEENKLRLYAFARLSKEDYSRVKADGFKWAPKQELFVAPMWTPSREDLLLEICGEIDDEDYSPEERAADRAERFGGYRDKRAEEAGASADACDSGPPAFGHQNRQRAEQQARSHDRNRTNAVSQWSKAEYWQARTEGVIRHALYKSSASVRRGRILTIETERRKLIARYTPVDNPPHVSIHESRNGEKVAHVWCGSKGRGGCWVPQSTLDTLAAGVAPWVIMHQRWIDHYDNRLAYERSMLAEEGGSAAEAEMEPGGWIHAGRRTGSIFTNVSWVWMQIHGVTKSPATGRVTSVKVMGTIGCSNPVPGLVSVNIERLGEGNYRAPTDEERKAFSEESKERKKAAKAAKGETIPLINPTDEDAERLQAIWNAKAQQEYEKHNKAYRHVLRDFVPTVVRRMTQAQYSAVSKGTYARYETVSICEHGRQPKSQYRRIADRV